MLAPASERPQGPWTRGPGAGSIPHSELVVHMWTQTYTTHFTAQTLPFQNTLGSIFTHTLSLAGTRLPRPAGAVSHLFRPLCSPSWWPGQVSAPRARALRRWLLGLRPEPGEVLKEPWGHTGH